MRLPKIFSRKSTPDTPSYSPAASTLPSPKSTPQMPSKVRETAPDSATAFTSPFPVIPRASVFSDIEAGPSAGRPLSSITLKNARPSQESLALSFRQASSDHQTFIFPTPKNETVIPEISMNWQDHIKSGFQKAKSEGVSIDEVLHFADTFRQEEAEDPETASVSKIYSSYERVSSDTNTTDIKDTSRKYTAEEWYIRGKSKACNDEHQKAIEYYNNALKQEVNAKYYGKIALSYFFLLEMNEAESYCNKSLETDKKYTQAYNTLSAIYRYYSRQHQHNPKIADAFLKQAEGYLKLAEKYSNPKAASANLLEKILIFMEKGDMKAANKSLHKVKIELQKQQDFTPSTEDLGQAEQNQQATISLIDDIAGYTKERGSIKEKSFNKKSIYKFNRETKFLPQEDIDVMNVIEKLKLSPEQALITELAKEIKQLKSNLGKLEEKSKEYVRTDQVSAAIAKNPAEMLEAKQMKEINSNLPLKEYFEALVNTIESAYLSAEIIADGQIRPYTSNPGIDVAAKLLTLIPICGNTVSGAVTQVTKLYNGREIKNSGAHLLTIAYSHENLSEKILPVARTATLDPFKKQQILSPTTQPTSKWFAKILNTIAAPYQEGVRKLYVENHDTDAKRLGHKDGCIVVKKWIEHQAKAKKTSSAKSTITDEDITAFIQRILTESANGETEPPTPSSTLPEDSNISCQLLAAEGYPEYVTYSEV